MILVGKVFDQAVCNWNETRQQSLIQAYISAGQPKAAETILKKSIAVIKDRNQPTKEKLNAIRILDELMELQDCALGLAAVPQLKVFEQIAKKAKETNPKARRPTGVFSSKTSDEDVSDFLSAVCELLDKWGRRFKEQDRFKSMPSLEEWNKARRNHLDYVTVPSPDQYKFVAPYSLDMTSATQRHTPVDSGGLEEHILNALIMEVQNAHRSHGAQDVRTADARARCESELRRWQDAAQAMAELDDMDFDEFQRLSEVAHRNAAILENLDSAPGGFGSPPSAGFGAPDSGSGFGHVPQSAGFDAPDSGSGFGHADGFGHAESFGRADGYAGGEQVWAGGEQTWAGGEQAWAGGEQAWAGGEPASHFNQQPPSIGPTTQLWGTPTRKVESSWHAAAGHDSESNVVRLEAQLQQLQRALAERMRQGHAGNMGNDLEQSVRRVQDLEAMQSMMQNAAVALESVEDVNEKMRDEVNRSREELKESRRYLVQAEETLQRKEDMISEARQRLFKLSAHAAQLEDQLREHGIAHEALQSKLQEKRMQHSATEVQLRRAHHAYNGASGFMKKPESSTNPFRQPGSPREGEAPLQSLARTQRAEQTVSNANALGPPTRDSNHHVVRQTPPEVWAQTPRASVSSDSIALRVPPGRPEWAEQANLSFRSALTQLRGLQKLYEDDRIAVEMSVSPPVPSTTSCPVIAFELALTNRGGQPLHDFKVQAQSSEGAPFKLRIQPNSGGSLAGVLWPQQQSKYWGELEMSNVFEDWPHAVFNYLLPDNLPCRIRLRLPLTIMRLMTPARLGKEQFLSHWSSPQLAHHEVAFICSVRSDLFGMGSSFSWARCLEFNGAFYHVPGVDEGHSGVVLVGSFPTPQGNSLEVLVRAELRHSGNGVAGHQQRTSLFGAAPQCRIAIRSASHILSHAVGKVVLEVLCDRP